VAVEIVMPRLSDSMEEGTILKWLVAEGDRVEDGQPLVEVETDKATVTHEAQAAGVILGLSVGEGATVAVGAPIAVIGEAGERLPGKVSADAVTVATGVKVAAGTDTVPPRAPRAKASPLARRIAARSNVDLTAIAGSGPHGRVIRADVERAAAAAAGNGAAQDKSPSAPPVAPSAPASASVAMAEVTAAKGDRTLHELTRGQMTVARRMAEARATVPDIELRSEVDMSEAVALREQLRELSDALPSINDFIVKAAALALRQFPRVNGAYRDGRLETYSRVNVGIAVAADDALVVPTIFDADTRSLREISHTARALAARVRDGLVTPADLGGGTFTVSNLGMYGVDSFSAIINLPQTAILAVGSLRPRPVVDESGAVVARPTIVLTLACDHRILYGVDGARFLARVRELLERPLSLLL
jgi:pyruvate dehydrogenase E2 component (dihydrolipoamide acetyltransferase)